jgi:dGTPase
MLNSYASIPEQSKGRFIKEQDDPIRNLYQRDRDRIIHSIAFKKLQYKTQVFVNHEGDLFRTRLTHSLEVAQVARTIAKQLKISEDLTEALALAHDLGHAPFGHTGENALNSVMKDYGGFDHNAQTLKIVTEIEEKYADFKGLNLTWETIEGITKHNGPMDKNKCHSIIKNLDDKMNLRLDTYASLEAQVASISDDIAYNNHDIEDGVRAGLLDLDELRNVIILKDFIKETEANNKNLKPTRLVNHVMRRMMNYMIYDIIKQIQNNINKHNIITSEDVRNLGAPLVNFSDEVEEYNKQVRKLLSQKVYYNFKVNRMRNKATRIVIKLFKLFFEDPACLPTEWMKTIPVNNEKEKALIVADYIAGMTDRYAINEYNSFFDVSLDNPKI